MPNHLHVMIGLVKTDQRINTIIGNGKRFMVYEMIKRLEEAEDMETLKILEESVESKRRENAQRHNVWQLSFDWKYCESEKFIIHKLDYFHNNPVKGNWNLCASPVDYVHSSARFYYDGVNPFSWLTNYALLKDVSL